MNYQRKLGARPGSQGSILAARRQGPGAGQPVSPLPEIRATDSAQRLAQDAGVSLRQVPATGKDNTVTAGDVRRYLLRQQRDT